MEAKCGKRGKKKKKRWMLPFWSKERARRKSLRPSLWGRAAVIVVAVGIAASAAPVFGSPVDDAAGTVVSAHGASLVAAA